MFKLYEYRLGSIIASGILALFVEYGLTLFFDVPYLVILAFWLVVAWYLFLGLVQDLIETVSYGWSKGRTFSSQMKLLNELKNLRKELEKL